MGHHTTPAHPSRDASRWRFWPARNTAEDATSGAISAQRLTSDATLAPEHNASTGGKPSNPASRAVLDIRCCGVFTVQCLGRDVTFTPSRKAREVLAFLATRPGMTSTTDELLTAVWPDAEMERSGRRLVITAGWRIRHALRTAVAARFKDAGKVTETFDLALMTQSALDVASIVRFDHGHYILDNERCVCDLARFRAEYARHDTYLRAYGSSGVNGSDDDARHALEEAQRLLALDQLVEQPLLAGETYTWLPALDRQLRELRLAHLRRALNLALRSAARDTALTLAERILSLDALDEPTVACAMRLQHTQGSSAAAVATYRGFRLALARRYGSIAPSLGRPSQEVETIYAQVVGDTVAAHGTASAPQAHAPPSSHHAEER